MKRSLILLAPLLTGVLCLFASAASAASCVSGSLQSYILLGSAGCTVDDKVFNNFAYTPPLSGMIHIAPGLDFTAPSVTAADVTVTPVPTSLDPGLKFAASWVGIDSDFPLVFNIDFRVTDTLGSNIQGESLVISAGVFHNLNVPGALLLPGSATVTDGSLMASVQNHLNPPPSTSVDLTDSRSFTPVQTLTSHIVGANSRSFINSVQENFSETPATVPEPSTWLLLSSGVAGVTLWRGIANLVIKRRHPGI